MTEEKQPTLSHFKIKATSRMKGLYRTFEYCNIEVESELSIESAIWLEDGTIARAAKELQEAVRKRVMKEFMLHQIEADEMDNDYKRFHMQK